MCSARHHKNLFRGAFARNAGRRPENQVAGRAALFLLLPPFVMESGKETRRELGALGEALAARYLKRRGFRILEKNVRCRFGELDLVAVHGGTVVFVEVKGKRGAALGRPEEMVTAWKRRRLTLLARWYLQRRGWLGRPARFDVVAVDWGPAGAAVRHLPDAFPATDAW